MEKKKAMTIKISKDTKDRVEDLPEGIFLTWSSLINPLLDRWMGDVEDNPQNDTNPHNRVNGKEKVNLTFPIRKDLAQKLDFLPRSVLRNKSAKIEELVLEWLVEQEKIIAKKRKRWRNE